MSWLDQPRKPHPTRKQLLLFAHEALANQYFAVVRATWVQGATVCALTETPVRTPEHEMLS